MQISDQNQKILNYDNLNLMIKNIQYAIQGDIVIRAKEIDKELQQVLN